MQFKSFLLAALCLTTFKSFANQDPEFTGWSALFHSQRFNEKWGLHLDLQARSADKFDYLKNILVRPGVTYFFNNQMNGTLGYAYVNTKIKNDILETDLTEHRIWEQFIYIQNIKKQSLMHRFRLEQRFIEQLQDDVFSERIRHFVRTLVPLTKQGGAFQKGMFLGLQNEIFFNVHNKKKVNNHFFDQNRAYVSFGYRFKSSFDLEIGYMNQTIQQRTGSLTNNIIQLAGYTRF